MENDQNNYRYQNTDSRPRTYNGYNQVSNQNKPNVEGNWRSRGLEGVNHPSSNNNFARRNFNDNGMQNNYRNNNVNSYNSYNQNNQWNMYLTTFLIKINISPRNDNSSSGNAWMNRYNRRGYVKKHLLLEDEEFFKEHLENLNMKKGELVNLKLFKFIFL